MLKLKKIINNEKGVVFILVISIIIVMMILAISILSINTSQVVSTEAEVRRLQAETYAMGVMDYAIALAANGTLASGTTTIPSHEIDGTAYNGSISYTPPSLNISVDY